MQTKSVLGKTPVVSPLAFVAPDAWVIGEVEVMDFASVWFGCVLRGDHGKISVGRYTNVQDGCILHEGVDLGEYVTVGHRALLHRCVVHSGALVGAGAVVWDDAVLEEGSMVGVGAIVPPGMKVKAGTLVRGIPAREIRVLSGGELERNRDSAVAYAELAKHYGEVFNKEENNPTKKED